MCLPPLSWLILAADRDYPASFSSLIEAFVLSSNFVALRVYLQCDVPSAGFVVGMGWLVRRVLGWCAGLLLSLWLTGPLPLILLT